MAMWLIILFLVIGVRFFIVEYISFQNKGVLAAQTGECWIIFSQYSQISHFFAQEADFLHVFEWKVVEHQLSIDQTPHFVNTASEHEGQHVQHHALQKCHFSWEHLPISGLDFQNLSLCFL